MSTNTIKIQLGFTYHVINSNLDGITQDESLVQPSVHGNCLNWVLGHIVASRNSWLELLGKEPIWGEDEGKRYARGSAPISSNGDEGLPFDRLRADFLNTQELLLAGLGEVTAEQLTAPAPFSPTGNKDETVGSLIAALMFHEAYHSGQIGVLRRIIGKDSAVK